MHIPKVHLIVAFLLAVADFSSGRRRIYGGEVISIEDAPFAAALLLKGHVVCGVSIISEFHVLTAARCLYNHPSQLSSFKVRYGTSTARNSSTGITEDIHSAKLHPNYKGSGSVHDIAVLRLAALITLTDQAKFLYLRNIPMEFGPFGEDAIIYGWGVKRNGVLSNNLRQAEVKIMRPINCIGKNEKKVPDASKYLICAKPEENSPWQSVCNGDWGGALTVDGWQVGIISHISRCDSTPDSVGQWYTDVYSHKKFIDNATGNNALWIPTDQYIKDKL